jgi:hypothetical protein
MTSRYDLAVLFAVLRYETSDCGVTLPHLRLSFGEHSADALRRLLCAGLIWCDGPQIRCTVEGREECENAGRQPVRSPSSTRAWKIEALTGIREDGSRSPLTRAALPHADEHGASEDGEARGLREHRRYRCAVVDYEEE